MTGSKDSRASSKLDLIPARARVPAAVPARNPFGLRAPAFVADALVSEPAPVAASTRPQVADESDYFAIVPSGPAVDPSEVETSIPAIEVSISWGMRDVLQVAHLSPPRAFVVGERSEASHEATPDFELEGSFLGMPRWPVAMPSEQGVVVIVPMVGSLSVRAGETTREHGEILASGALRASIRVPGALEYTLGAGETARVAIKAFVFSVRAVNAGREPIAPVKLDRRLLGFCGGVAALVLGAFGLLSSLAPSQAMLNGDQLDLDNRYVAALIEARQPVETMTQRASAEEAASTAASGEAGEAGPRDRPRTPTPSRGGLHAEPSSSTSSEPTIGDVAHAPVIDAVAQIAALFGSGPRSVYETSTGITSNSADVLGSLLGVMPGSGGGMGGLAPAGTGLGGGGTGDGTVGEGDHGVHTRGRGNGDTLGNCRDGDCGDLADRGAVHPRVPVPFVPEPTGGLTADQIRRVIQRNISQVQHCYEQGLQRNPTLAGRVTVGFIISPTGAVMSTNAQDGIGDAGVTSCIASAARRWAFPQPETGGSVSVRFPFVLQRSGQ